jgi:thiamine biosynthesis lipoprotein
VFSQVILSGARFRVRMAFHSSCFQAIGVRNQVTVCDPDALEQAAEIAEAEVAALDLACSRFRDDSEIVGLNRSGAQGRVVSPLLFEAVEVAIDAARATGGLVDPTVGSALKGLGYDRDFDVVVTASPKPTFRLVPASGWESVRLDRSRRHISLGRNAELDLGATAKAFSADRIARAVRAATGTDVLVSLGGDIAVAGTPAAGWPIHVGDDHKLSAGGQVVAIRQGALATSSTTVRRWKAGRTELHHIVDPSTGAPAAEHWRTVSVTAATCVDANAAATAAIVLGPRAAGWLEEHALAARLVHLDGGVQTVGGWPEDVAARTSHAAGRNRPARPAAGDRRTEGSNP